MPLNQLQLIKPHKIVCVYVCMYVYVCMFVYVCVYYVCVHVHVFVYVYVCVCACACVCVCDANSCIYLICRITTIVPHLISYKNEQQVSVIVNIRHEFKNTLSTCT